MKGLRLRTTLWSRLGKTDGGLLVCVTVEAPSKSGAGRTKKLGCE